MSHTIWNLAIRRTTVTACVVTAMTTGAPLLAQQTAMRPQTGTTVTTPQTPSGPTLELTMDQAVAMALEANLDLKTDRFNLTLAAQGIAAARAAFLPSLTGGLSRNNTTSVPFSQFETNQSKLTSSSLSATSRWAQSLPWYGSTYSAQWSSGRSLTNQITTFSPRLTSGLQLNFNQPLWQRFAIDSNRYGVENAERNHQIADLTLQQQILGIQDQVRMTYLGLRGAMAGLIVAKENRDVNAVALSNARARIAVGNAAEIDAIQSEAAVLSSEEGVINAEAAVSAAEDQLRELVLEPGRPDYWQVHLVPTDEMQVRETHVDVDAAIKTALANRLDLIVARRQIEQTQLGQRLTDNLTKPSVDLNVVYAASGTAGRHIDTSTGLPDANIGFGTALGDAFGNQNPIWTVGLNVGVPLGQTANKVSAARSQIQMEQQQTNLRSQELQVVAQVRDAARQVESGYRRVQSTQQALVASERQLQAEQRKLEVGMASTYDVLQRQQLLANARSAELNARIAYNRALILLERVQRIR